MMAASGDGACISESGEQLDTYEECSAALTAFGQKAQLKLVALAALTAVAYAEGMTILGLVTAAATAFVIHKELEKIQDGSFRRFINPVIENCPPSDSGPAPNLSLGSVTQGLGAPRATRSASGC